MDRVRTVEEGEVRRQDDRPEEAAEPKPIELGPATGDGEDEGDVKLLMPAARRDELGRTWREVQGSFIDEPQDAVRRADGLVQDVLRSVAEGFDTARRQLETEWQRDEGVNTESLRLAFRRYRALFERLLSV